MEVSAAPFSFRQLFEVHLQHPEVSVGEEEERGEPEVLSSILKRHQLREDVRQEGLRIQVRGRGGSGEEVGRVASLGSMALLQLPGVKERVKKRLRRVGRICWLEDK